MYPVLQRNCSEATHNLAKNDEEKRMNTSIEDWLIQMNLIVIINEMYEAVLEMRE